jgi:hypothetical protein
MADTAATTTTRVSAELDQAPARRPLATAFFGAACGLLLLYLAIPRTLIAFEALPGNPIFQKIQAKGQVNVKELGELVASRKAALSWGRDPALMAELGIAQLLRAEMASADRGFALIERNAGRQMLRQALARRPLDSFSWLELAYVDLLARRDRAAAGNLTLAIRMAVSRPGQFAPRIEMGLKLWNLLDGDQRDDIRNQIRLMWRESRESRDRAVALAKRMQAPEIFREALSLVPDGVKTFEQLSGR